MTSIMMPNHIHTCARDMRRDLASDSEKHDMIGMCDVVICMSFAPCACVCFLLGHGDLLDGMMAMSASRSK